MTTVRARTRTTRFGVERTNHEATTPPPVLFQDVIKSLFQITNRAYFVVMKYYLR